MDTLYIKASKSDDNVLKVDLVTLLILNINKICDNRNIKINIIFEPTATQLIKIHCDEIVFEELLTAPDISKYCIWPVLVVGNSVVAGLCSIARQLIKSCANVNLVHLLGFREACLMACSETSIWTKFCEVDMIKTVINILHNSVRNIKEIPIDLTKFEYHMEQPIRIHNVYAYARKQNNDKGIKSNIPVKELNLGHTYSEGPFITLADIILYPCFKILFKIFEVDFFETYLPLTYTWYCNMEVQSLDFLNFVVEKNNKIEMGNMEHSGIKHESLYTSDPNRYKPQNRIHTKQKDVENAINIIQNTCIDLKNDIIPFGNELEFDWGLVPLEANPEGGALPKKRANRKCDQLQNLAKAVIKIATNEVYTIVDFCSGSGHLGILLAILLPKSKIILVENKERSLLRAKERIFKLNITNIVILQCNLDYFCAKFDIGVSLHACGVATDLVIQNCVLNKAHFVSCPCCYGGIHDCYHVKYPRCRNLKNSINYKDYLNIAHAADQTHDIDNIKTKQGYLCMDIIDTDRKLFAEENGYEVFLGKLLPTTCTPKNNLIVGIYK